MCTYATSPYSHHSSSLSSKHSTLHISTQQTLHDHQAKVHYNYNITRSMENQHKNLGFSNDQLPSDDQPLITSCKATPHQEKNSTNQSTCVASKALLMEDASGVQERGLENELVGREKLMRHRNEVSFGGRIVVPETWSQEPFLKDWIDYSTFDALLAPTGAEFARKALVVEAQRRRDVSKLST